MRQTIFLTIFSLAIYSAIAQQQNFPGFLNQSIPTNLGWPPKFNNSNSNWPPNFNNNWPPKFNNSNNNWPPNFNNSNSNWPPKFNNSNSNWPPKGNNNWPLNFNNSNNNWPPKYNFSNNNWPPKYNFSNNNWPSKFNFSNNVGNKNNFSNFKPINQFPNCPKLNLSRYAAYNATANGTREGHLFLGQIQMYDRLLFSQIYRKESRWWTYRESIVEYPSGKAIGYARISAIRCYNQFLDGDTARASLKKGGPGFSYVEIRLESKWNKGFQYLVEIYGH